MKQTSLLGQIVCLIAMLGNSANAITVFPLTTNTNLAEVPSGFASCGTNSLMAVLAGTNVCFQLISTNGTLIGPLTEIGVSESFPLVAFGGGKYLMYWDASGSGGSYGQIISPDGSTNGPPFGITGSDGGSPLALASNGTNFLAMINAHPNFYGQIVTSAGKLAGQRFLISNQQQMGDSAAVLFGRTNYLVAWQSNNSDTGNINKTYGEFISSGGVAGTPFQISQTTSLDQNPLALGFDGTNYLAIWNVDTNLTAGGAPIWNLDGRLISQNGSFPGSELVLNTNHPVLPSLAFDGVNYLVEWSYNLDSTNSNKDVLFQFFNASVSPVGTAFSVFQPQGTNAPLIGSVSFDGSRFVAGAAIGSLQVAADGTFEGFQIVQTFGAFIPASTAVSSATQASWTKLVPASGSPQARLGQTAVMNAANGRMIIFGGSFGLVGSPPLGNDLWMFTDARSNEAGAWQKLSVSGGAPLPRATSCAAYDQANNRMILLGGNPDVGNCGNDLNDVWVLTSADGTGGTPAWVQLSPQGTPPSPRSSASAVYNPAENQLLVYGGNRQCSSADGDFWALTNANGQGGVTGWTQLSPAGGGPGPRTGHSAGYDAANHRMILFGGETASGSVTNDTWVLSHASGVDGIPTWTALNPAGPVPSMRMNCASYYDPGLNSLVIFGGSTVSGYTDDAWVLSNANGLGGPPVWSQLSPSGAQPNARASQSAVGFAGAGRLIIFGGANGDTIYNDAWALDFGSAMVSTAPPQIITNDSRFGFLANTFGFNVSGTPGQQIIIESSTNLLDWARVSTNTLGSSSFYFADPSATIFPQRFYRVHSP